MQRDVVPYTMSRYDKAADIEGDNAEEIFDKALKGVDDPVSERALRSEMDSRRKATEVSRAEGCTPDSARRIVASVMEYVPGWADEY